MEVKNMETNSTIIKEIILKEKDYDSFFDHISSADGDVRVDEEVIQKILDGSRKRFSVERTLEEPYPEISNDILKYNVVRYVFSDDIIAYIKGSNKNLEYRLIQTCLMEYSEEHQKFLLKYFNCKNWRASNQENMEEIINNLQSLNNFSHYGEKILSLFFSESLNPIGKNQIIFATEIIKIVGVKNFIDFLARKNQELSEDNFLRNYRPAYNLLEPINP